MNFLIPDLHGWTEVLLCSACKSVMITRNQLVKSFSHLVFGNWWIGFCAAALAQLSYHELGGEGLHWPLMVAVLGATVAIYNMNMLSGLKELRSSGTDSVRHHWVMVHEDALMAYLGVGCLFSLAFFLLHVRSWSLMVPATLVAIFYVLPLVGERRLREVGLWKIILIGVVWGAVTAGLPALQLETMPSMLEVLMLMTERALFVIAITIPFDVRDLSTDAHKGVHTLPSVLGWKRALVLAAALLAVSTWLAIGRLGMEYIWGYMPGIFIALGLIIGTRPSRPEMYYAFWLDGTMMLLPIGAVIQQLMQP